MSRRQSLLLAAWCASSACSNSTLDGPPVGKPLISPRSYAVHGRLTLTPVPAGFFQPTAPLPTAHDFILRVDPTGETSIAGGPGEAAHSALASQDGVAFRAVDGFSLALNSGSCGAQATYADFHFTAGVDALAGTATGTASIQEGDVLFAYSARLDFTGVPDTTGPVLTHSPTEQDPLLPLALRGSEPLPVQAKAQLVGPADHLDLVSVSPAGIGATTAFDKPDIALRYETRYALVSLPGPIWQAIRARTPARLSPPGPRRWLPRTDSRAPSSIWAPRPCSVTMSCRRSAVSSRPSSPPATFLIPVSQGGAGSSR